MTRMYDFIVVVIVKSLTFIVVPIGGTPIQLYAALTLPLRLALTALILGDLIGGTVNFFIGRLMVSRLTASRQKEIISLSRYPVPESVFSAIVLRVICYSIYDALSYYLGTSRMNYSMYVISSVVGGFVPTLFIIMICKGMKQTMLSISVTFFFLYITVVYFDAIARRTQLSEQSRL